MKQDLLTVERLSLSIGGTELLHNLAFSAPAGQITCLVGESGSGKSLTVASILGLLPREAVLAPDSRITFRGESIFSIYQDPINSFHPAIQVGKQLYQMARGYRKVERKLFYRELAEVMGRLRLEQPQVVLKKYPFELSGGMLQRLMIACAIYVAPSLIIADEPTTALDVSIQKEILREFRAINHELGITILVVTHDFGVVAELADQVVVLHQGVAVEAGDVFRVFEHPQEAYTKALLAASGKEEMLGCCEAKDCVNPTAGSRCSGT